MPDTDPNTVKGIQVGGGKAEFHRASRSVDLAMLLSTINFPRNVTVISLPGKQKLFFVPDESMTPFSINGEVYRGYGYAVGSDEDGDGEYIVDTSLKLEDITFP